MIAVVEALIALGPETAIGIDRGLRRAVDGEALLRRHGGAVVRHRGLGICDRHSGCAHGGVHLFGAEQQPGQLTLNKRTRNHRSGGRRRHGVTYCAAAPGDQNADDRSSKCSRWLAHVFLPLQPCPTDQRGAMSPTTRHVNTYGAVMPPTLT